MPQIVRRLVHGLIFAALCAIFAEASAQDCDRRLMQPVQSMLQIFKFATERGVLEYQNIRKFVNAAEWYNPFSRANESELRARFELAFSNVDSLLSDEERLEIKRQLRVRLGLREEELRIAMEASLATQNVLAVRELYTLPLNDLKFFGVFRKGTVDGRPAFFRVARQGGGVVLPGDTGQYFVAVLDPLAANANLRVHQLPIEKLSEDQIELKFEGRDYKIFAKTEVFADNLAWEKVLFKDSENKPLSTFSFEEKSFPYGPDYPLKETISPGENWWPKVQSFDKQKFALIPYFTFQGSRVGTFIVDVATGKSAGHVALNRMTKNLGLVKIGDEFHVYYNEVDYNANGRPSVLHTVRVRDGQSKNTPIELDCELSISDFYFNGRPYLVIPAKSTFTLFDVIKQESIVLPGPDSPSYNFTFEYQGRVYALLGTGRFHLYQLVGPSRG